MQQRQTQIQDCDSFEKINFKLDLSPFQLQITASVRKRPLRTTCLAAAVHELTLLFATERALKVKVL